MHTDEAFGDAEDGGRLVLTGALRPWKRFVLMVIYVYVVDCGNWKQHAAIQDPIRARDDVGMLQPRNASLEKSQCGLAGGAGGAEERRAAESFCGFCSLAHQARQLFDFFCRTFGHQPCILLGALKHS